MLMNHASAGRNARVDVISLGRGCRLYPLVSLLLFVLCKTRLDDKLLLRTEIMKHASHGRIARVFKEFAIFIPLYLSCVWRSAQYDFMISFSSERRS